MLLRSYRFSDLETLYQIDQACFPPGISYSREELAGFIAHGRSRTWIAEAGEEIVGFLIANRHPGQRLGHIITVDVVKAWRRRGVGKALMDAAEEWARQQGLQAIALETAEDNLAAQRFYAVRSYKKHEKLDGYYADGTAAWIMIKWLEKKPTGDNRRPKPEASER
jgi:ribosomal-protein-alanine N-acetyltransferase